MNLHEKIKEIAKVFLEERNLTLEELTYIKDLNVRGLSLEERKQEHLRRFKCAEALRDLGYESQLFTKLLLGEILNINSSIYQFELYY